MPPISNADVLRNHAFRQVFESCQGLGAGHHAQMERRQVVADQIQLDNLLPVVSFLLGQLLRPPPVPDAQKIRVAALRHQFR
ncbi:hypothetical protein J437_LFUL013904 [Ladona fulva]|nr:hypothetical protein J437_LFUL013904 [Ladona fulva]